MLTVDFDRLGVGPGVRAIDIGAGQGRHSYEMLRRGADVIAFDQNTQDMADVAEMFGALAVAVPVGAVVVVEAAAFAWLAHKTLRHETVSQKSITGTRGARVLGAIYPR